MAEEAVVDAVVAVVGGDGDDDDAGDEMSSDALEKLTDLGGME